MYNGGIDTVFSQKVIQEKSAIFTEILNVFMHNFLCQNVLIFPLYILLSRKIDTFWPKAIDKFWSGSISTVLAQKSHTKNQQYS